MMIDMYAAGCMIPPIQNGPSGELQRRPSHRGIPLPDDTAVTAQRKLKAII